MAETDKAREQNGPQDGCEQSWYNLVAIQP